MDQHKYNFSYFNITFNYEEHYLPATQKNKGIKTLARILPILSKAILTIICMSLEVGDTRFRVLIIFRIFSIICSSEEDIFIASYFNLQYIFLFLSFRLFQLLTGLT